MALLIAATGDGFEAFDCLREVARFLEFVDFPVEPRERACGAFDPADRFDGALALGLA
ncbi:MAG TPA: hypothetical protein VFN89_10515 [Solirubrobacterales bacterium]|nr:hypothetical protein [Solirubrobacterales bacterium]